jgi:hypothetical protein
VKREIPLRAKTFQKTISSGEDFENNSRAALLRVNLVLNGMTVKPSSKFDGGGGGGGGARGMMMGGPMMGGGMPHHMMGAGKRFG